jgi:hypothetical protein
MVFASLSVSDPLALVVVLSAVSRTLAAPIHQGLNLLDTADVGRIGAHAHLPYWNIYVEGVESVPQLRGPPQSTTKSLGGNASSNKTSLGEDSEAGGAVHAHRIIQTR